MTFKTTKYAGSISKPSKKLQKKDIDQRPWVLLVTLSMLFYGTMLFLSLYSKDIHNARLPQVTAERLGEQKFSYSITIDERTIKRTSSLSALPKEMVNSDCIFVLETIETEDFTYYYAKKVSVTIDDTKENPDYYAITDGLERRAMVIMSGYETLNDGDEVYYSRNEKETKTLSTENLFQ